MRKDVEKRESICSFGEKINYYSHCGKWRILKKLKIELSCTSAILLLGIYSGFEVIFGLI
jgi:hypothetical protein